MKLTKSDFLHATNKQLQAVGLRRDGNRGWMEKALGRDFTSLEVATFFGEREKKDKPEEHVSHSLILSPMPLTVGDLKRQLAELNIPDDAQIKTAFGRHWQFPRSLSFCREAGEVSLW